MRGGVDPFVQVSARTGGALLAGALEALGAPVAFGLPGVHNLAAWRALDRSSVRLVGVRHEQAAAYAADGYARATRRLGVALTTTGPGAANAVAAVGEAWASGSPVLVVATDIPTTLRRDGIYRGVLHETTDQAGMFRPVTKGTLRVEAASEIPAAVARAAAIALAPPTRPVYLEVPTDLLDDVAEDAPVEPRPAEAGRARPPAGAIGVGPPPGRGVVDEAAALLERAERPLVWAGGGAARAGAGAAVAALAERLAAPVLTTYGGAGLLPPEHPCAVGLPPHAPGAGALWDESDLVVGVGTDFDGMTTQNWAMPAPPALVAVNVDAADAAKNYRPDVVVEADAALGAAALAERVTPRRGVAELEARLGELRAAARRSLEADEPAGPPFLDAVAQALPPEAVLLADMCIPGYWLAGFHRARAPGRLLYPVGWGTLGFAFPAALGAAAAGAGPVVSVSGDGGFLYACGELATVAQERIALTVVIVDDGGYGMLRYDQIRRGEPPFGVDLHSPDFCALARSFGVEAEQVEGLGADFGAALARHVRSGRPSVLVAQAALKPPITTSPRWYRRTRPDTARREAPPMRDGPRSGPEP